MKLTQIDKMFLELKGIKIMASDDKETGVECKGFLLKIIDDKIIAWSPNTYMVHFGYTSINKTIKIMKKHKIQFDEAKTNLQKLLDTPIEEKKKYIYEHLEELEE